MVKTPLPPTQGLRSPWSRRAKSARIPIAHRASGRSRYGRRRIRTNPSVPGRERTRGPGAAEHPNEPETPRIAGFLARIGANEPAGESFCLSLGPSTGPLPHRLRALSVGVCGPLPPGFAARQPLPAPLPASACPLSLALPTPATGLCRPIRRAARAASRLGATGIPRGRMDRT
jgi:hypothetical protein